MSKSKTVKLKLYRYAGKFLLFRIKNRCQECDTTYAILHRLMGEELSEKPVSLQIVPWLDNFWKIIWRGGWHAPILTINGRVFSQGKVPDIPKLLQEIGEILDDSSLAQSGKMNIDKLPMPEKESEITVYFSPACPHCRQLLSYLDANRIDYLGKDVTRFESARKDVEKLTGKLSIPVIVGKGEIIQGFDKNRLKKLLGIPEDDEKSVTSDIQRIIPQFTKDRLRKIHQKAVNIIEKNNVENRVTCNKFS